MSYKLSKKLKNGVRVGELTTPNGKIETPFFMPVGTVGSVKSVSPEELEKMGAQIILCNTYHLYLRPGEKLIKKLGGLHKFVGWDKPILTDSGGYQVFSLGKDNTDYGLNRFTDKTDKTLEKGKSSLVKITEDGVLFKSFLDGSKHLFTPEKVIQIQLDLGVDILMPLDVCPSGKASRKEVEKAVELTIAWAERAKKYFDKKVKNIPLNKRPLLHGIVQGGLYEDLRKYCTEKLVELNFDGYSVGGLAVDFETRDMWKIVKLMGEILPENKQRYLMGVGTPDDIIKATKLGMDMFDCVLPTRLARHSNVYVRNSKSKALNSKQSQNSNVKNYKLINLLNSKYRADGGVIDENCTCSACASCHSREGLGRPLGCGNLESGSQIESGMTQGQGFSRAYISHLLRSNEILGIRLTTLHNLHQYLELMRELRTTHL